MILQLLTVTLKKSGCADPAEPELAVLQVENNTEVWMNRAYADGLHEIAVALARYLSCECRLDPNPAGRPSEPERPEPRRVPQTPPETGTPALVADLEYSVKEAMKITGLAEVTLRKMTSSGRLPYRKEGSRTLVLGKDLARIMAKNLPAPHSEPTDSPESE